MRWNIQPINAPIAHDLDPLAVALGVCRRTLEREIAAGRLSAVKIGRRTIVPADEVKRYVASLESRTA